MRESLLITILKDAPHVDRKIAADWVDNMILQTRVEIEKFTEIASHEKLEAIRKTVLWHIGRLNGFGGSDMSVLYTEYKGGYYPHEMDAAGIIAQKLCIRTPNGRNGDTERGTHLEPFAREKFRLKMRAYNFVRHDKAYDALEELAKKGGVPHHEWMQSKPDDVLIDLNTGEIWLVDYKCPASVETFEDIVDNPPDYYRAQLAQYKYHLEAAGIKIDHTALVPFSTKHWDVEVSEFTVNDQLMSDVLSAGDQYWNFVLKSELPLRPLGKNFQFSGEMPAEMQQVIGRFILIKKMSSTLDDMDKRNKRVLLALASQYGVDWDVPEMKTRLPGVDISKKSKVTINKAAIFSDFREGSGNPDDEKYKTVSDSTTVSVIRGKQNIHSDYISEIEIVGERAIEFAIEDLMVKFDYKLTDKQINDLIIDPSIESGLSLDGVNFSSSEFTP
jgi:hypothetical protein